MYDWTNKEGYDRGIVILCWLNKLDWWSATQFLWGEEPMDIYDIIGKARADFIKVLMDEDDVHFHNFNEMSIKIAKGLGIWSNTGSWLNITFKDIQSLEDL